MRLPDDSLSFMFESTYMFKLTDWALKIATPDADYWKCWEPIRSESTQTSRALPRHDSAVCGLVRACLDRSFSLLLHCTVSPCLRPLQPQLEADRQVKSNNNHARFAPKPAAARRAPQEAGWMETRGRDSGLELASDSTVQGLGHSASSTATAAAASRFVYPCNNALWTVSSDSHAKDTLRPLRFFFQIRQNFQTVPRRRLPRPPTFIDCFNLNSNCMH